MDESPGAILKRGFEVLNRALALIRSDTVAGFSVINMRLDKLDARLTTLERLLTSNRVEPVEEDVRHGKAKLGLG